MEIVINFKKYKTGKRALELAKKIKKYIPKAIICSIPEDVKRISKTNLRVFTQYYNKKTKAEGSLLNHSDHRISLRKIKEQIKNFNKVIICVKNINEAKKVKKLKPWAIAFEDPKLISTGKSITKYNAENVKKFSNLFKNSKIKPFCGAGISTYEDIKEAKKLGCKGVLISSAITLAIDQEKKLKTLIHK